MSFASTHHFNANGWLLLGVSVCGAGHRKKNLPNQDAVYWWPRKPTDHDPLSRGIILAVADGHGGQMYFRSAIGAALAVRAAVFETRRLLSTLPSPADAKDETLFKETLPKSIVHQWQRLVNRRRKKRPFSKKETEILAALPPTSQESIKQNGAILYGTTLMMVFINNNGVLYFQIGDGDILTMASDQSVQRAFERDPLLGGETYSLCLPKAWSHCRVKWAPAPTPYLVSVTSDGFADSYTSYEDFACVPKDIYQYVTTHRLSTVANISDILSKTSELGSGDDITLGLISRVPHVDHVFG